MKSDKMMDLKRTFGFDSFIYINSKKYNYEIRFEPNTVHISCDNWKGSVTIWLKFYRDAMGDSICTLDPSTFYIEIEKGLDTLRLEIPTSIKKDIISDFDSLMTDEFIDDLCKKENDRVAKEKELEKKENQKLVNEFFGIEEN